VNQSAHTLVHTNKRNETRKIKLHEHAGNVAKGEKAAELGLERLREQIHCKHGDDIRTGVFNRQPFF
jgi:hypothetical protein